MNRKTRERGSGIGLGDELFDFLDFGWGIGVALSKSLLPQGEECADACAPGTAVGFGLPLASLTRLCFGGEDVGGGCFPDG